MAGMRLYETTYVASPLIEYALTWLSSCLPTVVKWIALVLASAVEPASDRQSVMNQKIVFDFVVETRWMTKDHCLLSVAKNQRYSSPYYNAYIYR